MVKKLVSASFKEFYKINESVAKTTPMRTHYHSTNSVERWLWQQKKTTIKQLLAGISIKNIIDLGCGDGELIDIVNDRINYVGIDISPTQIMYSKKHIQELKKKNAKVFTGDISNLKLQKDSFDAALVCDVVEHVLRPEKLFREVKRIVKNNGYIIFSIPNEMLLQLARGILLRFPLRSPDHINALTPNDIRQEFPKILNEFFVPLNFSFKLSFISIILVQNVK